MHRTAARLAYALADACPTRPALHALALRLHAQALAAEGMHARRMAHALHLAYGPGDYHAHLCRRTARAYVRDARAMRQAARLAAALRLA